MKNDRLKLKGKKDNDDEKRRVIRKKDSISNNKRRALSLLVNMRPLFLQNHLQSHMKQKIGTTADVYTTREKKKIAIVHQMAPKKK